MKLSTRMWLSGALVPAVLLSVGLLVAARVFRDDLMAALDQGLLAQAAAESVSLFDRPDGPHLHMAESPLLEAVRPFAPTGELFDAQGRLVAHFPPLPHRTDVQAPTLEGTGPLLSTLETPQGRVRQLVARIARAEQASFVLRLSASMAQIDASVRQFHEVSIAFIVFTTLALMSVQWVFARRLSTRLGHLSAHSRG